VVGGGALKRFGFFLVDAMGLFLALYLPDWGLGSWAGVDTGFRIFVLC